MFRSEIASLAKIFELKDLGLHRRYRNEAAIRSLCANAYLGEDRILCRVLGRYKMFVDAQDIGLSSHLLLDGYWEMWLTEVLADTIRPGMMAADIGANLGYFTMIMADLVGETGAVHAFEPNERIAMRLRQSVQVNGFGSWATVHETALSDAEGDQFLVVPLQEPKNGYLNPTASGSGSLAVKTRRLDQYADLANVDVLKIDADGSEERIWDGMEAILRRGRPMTVFLEFAAARYADAGAFLDQIAAHGFSLSWLTVSNGAEPVTREAILAAPPYNDLMLVLRR
jgi:FkbM family methyltransferase